MLKLPFTLKVALLVIAIAASPCMAEPSSTPIEVSNRPGSSMSSVYIGKEPLIPDNAGFIVAIELPVDKSGAPIPPPTLLRGFEEMKSGLPHWYLTAWKFGQGTPYECDVEVNGLSYAFVLSDALWGYWNVGNPDSPLRRELQQLGIEYPERQVEAIGVGFCAFMLNGPSAVPDAIGKLHGLGRMQ